MIYMEMNFCPFCGAELRKVTQNKEPEKLYLKGKPTPTQVEFFEARGRYILFAGPMACGKTWALRRKAVLMAMKYPEIDMLLLTKYYPESRNSFFLPLQKELQHFCMCNFTEGIFTFPNGSRIFCCSCKCDEDVWDFAGMEFAMIGIDNAELFTDYQIEYLKTRNRTVNGQEPRMYFTAGRKEEIPSRLKRPFIEKTFINGEKPEDYALIETYR